MGSWSRSASKASPTCCRTPTKIRYSIRVEVVVDKGHNALLLDQHLPKSGPVCELHGGLRGLVDVFVESGGSDGSIEVGGRDKRVAIGVFVFVVVIAEDDGNDVERMCFDPCHDFLQVVLDGAGVEEIARRVAVVEGAVDVVSLALEHADTIVQLLSYVVFLITAYVSRRGER